MSTGEELNARSADLDSCDAEAFATSRDSPYRRAEGACRGRRARRHRAPAALGPERLSGPRSVHPLHRLRGLGQEQEEQGRQREPELEQLRRATIRRSTRSRAASPVRWRHAGQLQQEEQLGDKSSKKDQKDDKHAEDTPSSVVPPVGSGGDDDDDDGALSSASSALTDWDEPLVPGLVALAALLTLGGVDLRAPAPPALARAAATRRTSSSARPRRRHDTQVAAPVDAARPVEVEVPSDERRSPAPRANAPSGPGARSWCSWRPTRTRCSRACRPWCRPRRGRSPPSREGSSSSTRAPPAR